MERKIRGIFFLFLCSIISCAGNRERDVGMARNTFYVDESGNQAVAGKDDSLYFYIGNGRSGEISYISYSVVVKKNGEGEKEGNETRIVRVVEK